MNFCFRIFTLRFFAGRMKLRYPINFNRRKNIYTLGSYRYFCTSEMSEASLCMLKDTYSSLETDEFESDELSPFNDIKFSEITSDPEEIKTLKRLQLEVNMMYLESKEVPSKLSKNHWIELLARNSRSQRIKYLHFLWRNENLRNSKKIKKAEAARKKYEKSARDLVEPKFTTSGPILYNLKYNTLFLRIYESRINRYYSLRLAHAMWFGLPLLVDCNYEPYMTLKNMQNCVLQMVRMWRDNREHVNPYHVIFCNMSNAGMLMKKLRNVLPTVNKPDSFFSYTYKNYLDLYPKEKLVYLTPDADEDLESFNSDDIYIIGAYVDASNAESLSFAKAKKEGLRMVKFPLDKYLVWCKGTKSLTLNQCLAIMNEMKQTNDWKLAFRHVPSRKLQEIKNLTQRDLEKMNNYNSARLIREHFRRNLVYDLIEKERLQQSTE